MENEMNEVEAPTSLELLAMTGAIFDFMPPLQRLRIALELALKADSDTAKGLTGAHFVVRNNARANEFAEKVKELHALWVELLGEEVVSMADATGDVEEAESFKQAWEEGKVLRLNKPYRWAEPIN